MTNAEGFNLVNSTEKNSIGSGSWKANGKNVSLYLPISSLGEFTIGDIESITYDTNKDTDGTEVDFYLQIYTMPEEGGDASWYGYRINAEPYFSINMNAPANEWNTWSTDVGTNQLRLFDSNRGAYGTYEDPTLAEFQQGNLNMSNYHSAYDKGKEINYSDKTVKYIAIGTGSGWADGFTNSYLDNVNINLKGGKSVTIDLE